ncbi:TetR/AcrR family transcriptional regulator [Microbacterium aerolatum]|jgi:AcrR family transcriptional regulator|uniref:TetR family transcriptional regulator n=1 Tax=Microbacterium aerolatum TaxID=153731 RepID=A0A511ACR9_9MICO|nr:TetR/AcrR family transcriptional regulator [Microbacterium aerolatum]MCK3768235.1 TetR/AcrR family transcriptional regulator [Microbacterium aerolatum]GEK85964.1 TetR family transcriptional regulator [Microbacterium aerolatum]GGB27916.1 TetR family transcriptional regulator [Microbacterium aerolatum]
MTSPLTARDRAKAERSDALLTEAARLFAARGYSGVSLEDIGAAVGVSGPAVYRHFTGKQALLGAVLVRVSEDLVSGGSRVFEAAGTADERMEALIDFHVDFALGNADVIRVHDRDLAHLADEDQAEVRRLQRAYIDLWISALEPLHDATADELRLRVQACFGLINSTPHSTRSASRSKRATAAILCSMARGALRA